MEIEVFGLSAAGRPRLLGNAASFGEARRMQEASLPEDLRPAYAGIQGGMPLFYEHMLTDDLRAKYPQLAADQED